MPRRARRPGVSGPGLQISLLKTFFEFKISSRLLDVDGAPAWVPDDASAEAAGASRLAASRCALRLLRRHDVRMPRGAYIMLALVMQVCALCVYACGVFVCVAVWEKSVGVCTGIMLALVMQVRRCRSCSQSQLRARPLSLDLRLKAVLLKQAACSHEYPASNRQDPVPDVRRAFGAKLYKAVSYFNVSTA